MSTERSRAVRPAKKRFGQHFLERPWAEKVVGAIHPSADEVVLEIGPGRGAITTLLAPSVRELLAFEIDRDLASALRQAAAPNVHVVEGDFLSSSAEQIKRALATIGPMPASIRVAGNLPYNVASPILFKLVELYGAGLQLQDATVMLQREVAVRLLARPGTKDYGVLTVLLGRHATIEPLLHLPRGAFRPPPKVQSTLVRLTFHRADPPVHDEAVFEQLVQAIFTRRRKTLANALQAYPLKRDQASLAVLLSAGIDSQRRPETLSVPELVRLSDILG